MKREEGVKLGKCLKCKRQMKMSHLQIHMARCEGLKESSKKEKPSKKEDKKPFNDQIKIQKSQADEIKPSKQQIKQKKEEPSKQIKKSKSLARKEEEDQKIPCYQCGYKQTFKQLDSHPKVCTNRQIPCEFCMEKFPRTIMHSHLQVCERRAASRRDQQRRAQQRLIQRNRLARLQAQRRQAQRREVERLMRSQTSINGSIASMNARHVPPSNSSQTNSISNSMSSVSSISSNSNELPQRRYPYNRISAPVADPNQEASQSSDEEEDQEDHNIFSGRELRIHFQRRSRDNVHHHSSIRAFHLRGLSNVSDLLRLIQRLANRYNDDDNDGLKKEEIAKIPQEKYRQKSSQTEPETCSICVCDFQPEQVIKHLKCNHLFHVECISKWLAINALCPLCKASMKEERGPSSQQQQSSILRILNGEDDEEDEDFDFERERARRRLQ